VTLAEAARLASAAVDRMSGAAGTVQEGSHQVVSVLNGRVLDTRVGEIQGRIFTMSPGDPRFARDTRIAEIQSRIFTMSPGDPRFSVDTRVADIQSRIFTMGPGDPRYKVDRRIAEIQSRLFTISRGDPRWRDRFLPPTRRAPFGGA